MFFLIRLSPQCTANVEHKIDHTSKTKSRKIVKLGAKFVSEHCASLGTNFIFQTILRILNNHIAKTENPKIDFSFDSEHCKIFWTKKIGSFLWPFNLHVVN